MQSKGDKIETMPELKKIIFNIAFKHQKQIDCCAWAFLNKNEMLKDTIPVADEEIYKILSSKTHRQRINTMNEGPLLCFKEDGNPTVAKITDLIFTENKKHRTVVYEHFLKMKPGFAIGFNTITKLKKIKEKLMGDDWIYSGIIFYDTVNIDWLCNLMGLEQASEIKIEQEIEEFAVNVFRPEIASIESIGVGSLQPSYAKDSYVKDFLQISNKAPDLYELLDGYFYQYGHVPLCYNYSLFSMLDEFFEKHSYDKQKKWDSLWEWASKKGSPLPRYHVCCYFISKSENVPENQLPLLYDELINIIHMPSEEEAELHWTSSWRLRCELAKHFGQFLESKLPGASTEKVYTQAWWIGEKIALAFGQDVESIARLREYVISSEYMSHLVWQTARPKTQSSSLRYATLMTSSLWAISIISQIDRRFLDYICRTDLKHKDLFIKSIAGFLVGCFPLNASADDSCIYPYDKTCVDVAEFLSKNYKEPEKKEQLSAFITAVKGLADNKKIVSQLKTISESNEGEMLLIAVAMRVMVYTDLMDSENEIWEAICTEEWITNIFIDENDYVVDSVIISLMELILQKQEKWAWQLPHLFSVIYENNLGNEKIEKIAFACVIISSICSDTISALRRTLLSNKALSSQLRSEWSERLKEIYNIAPDSTKSRLRPILLCLNI